MKSYKHHRLFQASIAVLALGVSGLLVYNNTVGPAKLATAAAGKTRSDFRDLASRMPHASKAQEILPVTPQEILPNLGSHILFKEFNDWAVEYAKATPEAQQQMLSKGETMIKDRQEKMVSLIENSPQLALDEYDALSPLAREALPESLKSQLEQPVNALGKLTVIAYAGKDVTPYKRFTTLEDQEYTVYPAGDNERLLTESDRSLLGIKLSTNSITTGKDGIQYPRIDRKLALRKARFRELTKEEVTVAMKARRKGAVPTCEVSPDPVTVAKTPAAIETGGNVKWLCGPSCKTAWLKTPEAIKLASMPAGAVAAGDPSSGSGAYFPGQVGWAADDTTKNYLCARFLCSDQTTTRFDDVTAIRKLVGDMLTEISTWSCGRIKFSEPTVPTDYLRLPHTLAEYKNGQYDAFADAKAMVGARYNLSQFSFYSCCIEGVYEPPAFATMGGKDAMMGFPYREYFIHELGHNLGLPHANLWAPSTSDPIGPGEHVSNFGAYNMMSDYQGPFNTMDRFYLRWLRVNEIHDVGFRTEGAYNIYDPDVATLDPARKYAISVPRSDGSFYFLEYRPNIRALVQPRSADMVVDSGTVNGLRILRTRGAEQLNLKPPHSGQRPYNGTLLVGEQFYDAEEGIRISVSYKGGSGSDQWMQVRVSLTRESAVSGRTYHILSKDTTQPIGIPDNSVLNGRMLSEMNFEGFANQKWTLMKVDQNNYRIININSRKIIEVGGNSTTSGGAIQQWRYVGSPSQKWQIEPTSSRHFKITNSGSGLALSRPAAINGVNQQLRQFPYGTAGMNQEWSLDEINPLTTNGNYMIISRNSGKAMDVSGSSFADNTAIYQWDANRDSSFQKWTASTQGGAVQAFTNVATRRALQVGSKVPGGLYGVENSDPITQSAFTGNVWQKWTLVAVDFDAGGFWYKILNVGGGRAADVSGASFKNGAPIQQYSYWSGGLNQQWRLTQVP